MGGKARAKVEGKGREGKGRRGREGAAPLSEISRSDPILPVQINVNSKLSVVFSPE